MNRTHSQIHAIARRAWLVAAAGMLLLCSGCFSGNSSRELVFEPESRRIEYHYEFDQAYAAPAADGGYDLVLTSKFGARSPQAGTRVYPARAPLTSQVLHIHVSWRPSRGTKSDYPAATNSTLRWHVFRGDPAASPDRTSYGGVGFVAVDVGKTSTTFELRDVRVRSYDVRGVMRDPLGPSRVSGIVRAQNDAPAAREILRQLEADLRPAQASEGTLTGSEKR